MAGNHIFNIKKWAKIPQTCFIMDPNPENPSAECPALPQTCPAVWHCQSHPHLSLPRRQTALPSLLKQVEPELWMLQPLRLNSCILNNNNQKIKEVPRVDGSCLGTKGDAHSLKAQSLPQICPSEGNCKSMLFPRVFRLDFLLITASCSLPHCRMDWQQAQPVQAGTPLLLSHRCGEPGMIIW